MATVNAQGIAPKSLADYVASLGRRFQDAFGPDFSLAPETPQGQIIGIMALELVEHDEAIVALGNAMSVDHAAGLQLDDLAGLLDITRFGASKSQVTAQLTGVAGTAIPAGSRARTADGTLFETIADAVLTTGVVDVDMQALDVGAVEAAAGELNVIVTIIAGWETVTNRNAAAVGLAGESDGTFRARLRARTAHSAIAPVTALESALAEARITSWNVVDNHTTAVSVNQDFALGAHSLIVIAEGGVDTDITQAVRTHKGMGAAVTLAVLGGEPDNGTLATITNGTITWAGADYTGLSLAGRSTGAERASALTTLLAAAGVTVRYSGERYIACYNWQPGQSPAFTGAHAAAFGLTADEAVYPPGPFIRPTERALTISAAVTINRAAGFPADGLAQMRAAVLARVANYAIGEQLWQNDILTALESVPGTRVTSLNVEHDSYAVSGDPVPLNNRWTIESSDLTLTIT